LLLAGTLQAGHAAAQATSPAPSTTVEEVVVTTSRIVRDGYQAPTPTTVLGQEDIQQAAQTNLFSTIAQLPALSGNVSTQTGNNNISTGVGGIDALNLRSLGTNRTLVLLDGRRTVGATLTGVADISSLPQALVSRVDVVTGGASASWGSDAVAGVVNFILDKKFTGLKGEVASGVTTYGDDRQNKFVLTAGAPLFNGRGHVLLNAEYIDQDGIKQTPRSWYNGWKTIQYTIAQTPAGMPQYLVEPHVGTSQAVDGGLITAGPLKGTAFGANGVPYPFQYGTKFYAGVTGDPLMAGGQWETSDLGTFANLDTSLLRRNVYGRMSYDFSDDLTGWVEGSYANVNSASAATTNFKAGNLTIQCDNAFLPAEVTTACAANRITSFAFGTMNKDLGLISLKNVRNTSRFAAGVDGRFRAFGKDWTWNANYGRGDNVIDNYVYNDTITNYYLAAIDAVRAPNGTIVCRSAAAQAAGCVPLNVIGTGVASDAARNWVLGQASLHLHLRQQTAAVAFNGSPFDLWAGPVSVAFGAEWREESVTGSNDCASSGNCGDPLLTAAGTNYMSGNFRATSGSYNVKEAFGEVVVPLAKDLPWVRSAELSGALRLTDYSTAGFVKTWKLGFSYSPIDDIRFRGTRSQDIRAPNLQDLYLPGQVMGNTITDNQGPFAGQSYQIQRPQVGNVNLKPEVAQTLGLGVVVQPHWLPGFAASVDYYRIKITNAIATLSNQNELDLCLLGNASICDLIQRDSTGKIVTLTVAPVNLASQKTDGFDLEASYRASLSDFVSRWDGALTLRALGTNIRSNVSDSGLPGSVPHESAGENSGSSPKWRVVLTQKYDLGRLSTALTERWISSGVLNTQYIECQAGSCPTPTINAPTINDNHVPDAWYVDYTLNYKVIDRPGRHLDAYFRVDNLFNKAPPVVAGSANISPGANVLLYDLLGRYFHVGVRFSL
jgi:iron complex outermembrane receptor protein